MALQYDETMVAEQPAPRRGEMPTEVIGGETGIPPQPGAPFGPGPAPRAETMILGGPPPSFAWLVIREGPRAGRLFRLDAEGTTIGRDPQCDIILDDEAASRRHAKVWAEENEGGASQFFIQDLATSNGTFVNGEQILKQALSDGDVVETGETKLVFKQV